VRSHEFSNGLNHRRLAGSTPLVAGVERVRCNHAYGEKSFVSFLQKRKRFFLKKEAKTFIHSRVKTPSATRSNRRVERA
jgi:hypothetical protein